MLAWKHIEGSKRVTALCIFGDRGIGEGKKAMLQMVLALEYPC